MREPEDTLRGDAPVPGYLGPQLAVRGRLSGTGHVTIDGAFEGEIEVAGHVAIGAGAHVRAPIRARAVAVAGHVEGAVSAVDVHVRAGGQLAGDVRAQSVGLDDGGALLGMVEMDFELPPELES